MFWELFVDPLDNWYDVKYTDVSDEVKNYGIIGSISWSSDSYDTVIRFQYHDVCQPWGI